MPLGRIMIEQTLDAWTAEVESGGITARCRVVRAPDLDAIVERALEAYREISGLAPAAALAPKSRKRK